MSSHIVNVNESDFQAEVLLHSNQRPVVVDFWADWCVPCRTLDPILEKLTEEANGAFRLAKVDVDANPKVANDYGVRGIPAIKVFRNGQVVAEFSGLRPEPQVREFIKALAPATSDLNVGRADSLLTDEEWSEAEEIYRQVLDENPDHPGSLLGLARSLIAEGASSQALPILRAFPVSKEYAKAEQLRKQSLILKAGNSTKKTMTLWLHSSTLHCGWQAEARSSRPWMACWISCAEIKSIAKLKSVALFLVSLLYWETRTRKRVPIAPN